jgi:actin related protein 2/3 complex subunit 2
MRTKAYAYANILMEMGFLLQFSMRNTKVMVLSVALPLAPPEAILYDGLPLGAIDAIKAAYGTVVQILDPPKDGFDLTMKINLTKLPSDEGSRVPFPRLSLSCCVT